MDGWKNELHPSTTPGAQVVETQPGVTRLQIPAGASDSYRLAQLDDYNHLPRKDFPWSIPFHMTLEARASALKLPGTWGFGFWNDPFGVELGRKRRLRTPVLPNSAWFFFASPPNYLTLDDTLPSNGQLAATFRTTLHSSAVLVPGVIALPLLLIPVTARILRRTARMVIDQDAADFLTDPTEWHKYELLSTHGTIVFSVDGARILETQVNPRGNLGFVLWVDNRYAALTPDGKARYGTLKNPDPAWVEVKDLHVW